MQTYKSVPINEYFVANGLTYRFVDGAVRRVHFDGRNLPPWLEDESVLDQERPPVVEASKCGFTLDAKVKHAPFACGYCGSRNFHTILTMTADANPSYSAPDGTVPVIRADMDVYAVTVQCNECNLIVPGSGYTHE